MYADLVIFRNELKNTKVPRYKLIGITTEILLSKEVFRRNSEINLFLRDVFNMRFKTYVMKSRTMIIARISRNIYVADNKQYVEIKSNLLKFINREIKKMQKEVGQKKGKNQFDGWLKGNE